MATYVYETIPQSPDESPVCFEVQQSMRDAALTHHPETGVPVRRIISGGFGFYGTSDGYRCESGPGNGGHCCGPTCGCAGSN